MPTPAHLLPTACYVCGAPAETHATGGEHVYWSNEDASREFLEADRHATAVYPTGDTTAEAAYVSQHRPY